MSATYRLKGFARSQQGLLAFDDDLLLLVGGEHGAGGHESDHSEGDACVHTGVAARSGLLSLALGGKGGPGDNGGVGHLLDGVAEVGGKLFNVPTDSVLEGVLGGPLRILNIFSEGVSGFLKIFSEGVSDLLYLRRDVHDALLDVEQPLVQLFLRGALEGDVHVLGEVLLLRVLHHDQRADARGVPRVAAHEPVFGAADDVSQGGTVHFDGVNEDVCER